MKAPAEAKPSWLKIKLPTGKNHERIKAQSREQGLNTVCEEARCPNIAECWGGGTATFMVLGEACSRACRFCSVAAALRLPPPDLDEPRKLAETLASMGLDYTVLTMVARDDLPDQGAGHVADCIRAAKAANPGLLIEVLVSDFSGRPELIAKVLEAAPAVFAHNVETVERLSPRVRDARASYRRSLEVLRLSRELAPAIKTKSSLMLGLGETEDELLRCFDDLRAVGCDVLTLGQYLRPGGEGRFLPVETYVSPAQFERLGELARAKGFLYVASGPFVRSSYRAGELFMKGLIERSQK